jgi:ATP-dependent DNA helicase RecQ
MSTGRDTCFLNIVGRHRPPCLTAGSQEGSVSHHAKVSGFRDRPNGARGKPPGKATIGICASFRQRPEVLVGHSWHPPCVKSPDMGPAAAELRRMLGAGAVFRSGQFEAISTVAKKRRRVLLVQRTGWGKSAVYFIATKLLRDDGAGPSLLVSPLLALMRNQIEMASRIGIRAATINSANPEEWDAIHGALDADEVDILLVSPERFNNDGFRDEVLPTVARRVGLLVVDEAHCISDWGHDFRPDYRRIVRVLDLLPRGVPVICTTATANDRVVGDIVAQLGHDLVVLRGPLDRESLALSVMDLPSQADRLAWLATVIPTLATSGVVYCLTVEDTRRVARFLAAEGIDAEAYSGDTDPVDRERIEQALIENEVKVVVATSALGMGFDKPDLGFVIHYQSPGSPIAYYQQVGRAGRALDHAPAVLLRGHEDEDIQDYFIRTAFPSKQQAEQVVGILQEAGSPMSVPQILAQVNVRKMRLEGMLKVLEVDGAIAREKGKYLRTLAPWAYDEELVASVTAARRSEQQAMRDYAATDGCLMEFLRRQLDDLDAAPCGRCENCTKREWNVDLDAELVERGRAHLRNAELFVDPRKVWPSSLGEPKGKISEEHQLKVGRALSVYNDGGWGGLVRRGKQRDGAFDPALVTAATKLIRERWSPDPFPAWLTCVPSREHPMLVPDFARALAEMLGIPLMQIVRKVRDIPPQKEMENSAQQLRNVYRAFEVTGEPPVDPVLLVDDIVDSGWTLTVIGTALRHAGAGPVYPFVLAKAVSG